MVLVRADLKGHHPAPSQGWARGTQRRAAPRPQDQQQRWAATVSSTNPGCSGDRPRVFPEHLKAAAASKAQGLLGSAPERSIPSCSRTEGSRAFPVGRSQSRGCFLLLLPNLFIYGVTVFAKCYPCHGSPGTQCFLMYPWIVTSQSDSLFSHGRTGEGLWRNKPKPDFNRVPCLRKRRELYKLQLHSVLPPPSLSAQHAGSPEQKPQNPRLHPAAPEQQPCSPGSGRHAGPALTAPVEHGPWAARRRSLLAPRSRRPRSERKSRGGELPSRAEPSRAAPPPPAGWLGWAFFFSLFLFGSAASLSSSLPAQPGHWLQEACYTAYRDAPLLVQRITAGLTEVFKTTQLNM